jgi:methyl-accepting chemotaxis protein
MFTNSFGLNLNVSWKQKLFAVIAITLLGLIVLTISAFIGLNSVNQSFQKQKNVEGFKQSSLYMVKNILKLEALATTMSVDKTEEYQSNLNALSELLDKLSEQSAKLNYQESNAMVAEISDLSKQYITQRTNWLNNRLTLGFTDEEGQLAQLSASLRGLEEASFLMVEEAVNKIVSAQRKYGVDFSQEYEALIEASITELNDLSVQFKWDEYPIGTVIEVYGETYSNTKPLAAVEQETRSALASITPRLIDTIEKKSLFLEEKVTEKVNQNAENARKSALQFITVAAVVVGLITLLSLGGISRQLNIQLHEMRNFLKKVAEGDFTKKLSTNDNHNDEFTQLRTASNQMVNDISIVMTQVVDGNKSLLQVRSQLGKAVEQLAVNSSAVEQKTEQSTVATQQISTAVNDVAQRSVEVSETAQTASKATQTGGMVVNDCVSSMTNIVDLIQNTHEEVSNLAQSSSKMLGIIDVINGLADQTNLLALNAAIESARAGEAGRGFSVVADEVRALAQKTVSATSSIGDIIQSFNEQSRRMGDLMEEGIKMASSGQENANNAKVSFDEIEEAIQKVAAEMDQVVVAVEEISYNSNDIATQVQHICTQSESTKETRHTLENYTNQLSTQAESLGQLTNRFKI